MDIPLARAMHVTVQQKSIRHKSPRMYHGVYSGGDRRTTSERERGRGEEGSKQSLYLCSTLLLLRSFVRSVVRSFDPLFYARSFGACSTYRVSEQGRSVTVRVKGVEDFNKYCLGVCTYIEAI